MLRLLLGISAYLLVSGFPPLAAQGPQITETFEVTGGFETSVQVPPNRTYKGYSLYTTTIFSDQGAMKFDYDTKPIHLLSGIFTAKYCVALKLAINRKSKRRYYEPTDTFVVPLPPKEPFKTCEFFEEVMWRIIFEASPENPATITVSGDKAKKHTFKVDFEGESVSLPYESAWHK